MFMAVMKMHLSSHFLEPRRLQTKQRTAAITIMAVSTFLGTLIVFLRFVFWLRTRRESSWSNVIIFIAWVSSLGYTIASAVAIRYGVGLHNVDVDPSWPSKAVQATYFVELFYYCSLYFIKMSIICVYLHLTRCLPGWFRRLTWVTSVLLTAHFISTLVVVFVQCRPLRFYWGASTTGTCISISNFFYSTIGFTIATDIIILALPVRSLMSVKRPPLQKAALLGAFLVGGLATVCSCIRTYSIAAFPHSTDWLYHAAPINYWSFVEINLGIFCASAPAIRAMWNHLFRTGEKQSASGVIRDVKDYSWRSNEENATNESKQIPITVIKTVQQEYT